MYCPRMTVLSARAVVVCCCLLGTGVGPAVGESDSREEPAGSDAAADTAGGEASGDAKHEDLLDRVFSPLDDAVSDINRSLNKGGTGPEPEGADTDR